ncbi:hypothetical protein B566_EDAN015795 [Ephemera danica]|nr:hypothetical protein B566_EDAN015795 [Ephemera danica]
MVMFLAQISHCYPEDLATFPQEIIEVLQSHSTILDPNMRMAFCRALVLLRGKGLLAPTDLLSLFFSLLRCQDKALRTFLQNHIISDVSGINVKHKNAKINKTLQNFMYGMLKDSNSKAAKMSLDIMVQLYKKNIWNDTKTVNVISTACLSKFPKVKVASLKFFVGKDPETKDSDDSDSEEEEISAKGTAMANRFNKKSRKREKQLQKVVKLVKKQKKKKSDAPAFNFSALHLIHDPQGFAEQLFRTLERTNERFEVKLLTLDVVSRLIGLHQLFLLNFYPYLQRFLQPHQREVTRLLQFVAQASHELVPPDVMQPVLKTLVNNFVTERNSSDVMAIGLNAVRAVCSRCPLAMEEDLLRDLVDYKNYRDRSVMMAARSLISLYRLNNPELLKRRDRGRPTEASIELKCRQYGELDVKEHIPGAEVLLQKKRKTVDEVDSDESDEDDGEWVDVQSSGDEEKESEDDAESDEEESDSEEKNPAELAKEVSSMRILTDEDFKAINMEQVRKQVQPSKSKKRKAPPDDDTPKGELVSLGDIENIYKKRKHDKLTRIAAVKKGQEGREKFGFQDRRLDPHSSKTNKEKKKKKAFAMVKHKMRGKIKRSFKDKQRALRNHLIKMKRLK